MNVSLGEMQFSEMAFKDAPHLTVDACMGISRNDDDFSCLPIFFFFGVVLSKKDSST